MQDQGMVIVGVIIILLVLATPHLIRFRNKKTSERKELERKQEERFAMIRRDNFLVIPGGKEQQKENEVSEEK